MKKQFDALHAGLIPGLIFPLIIFILIIFVRKNDDGFITYFEKIHEVGIAPKLLSLCLLPNLLLFFVFLWTERLRAARGVIASMFLFGLAIVILKLI